jgi:hypothetical protein
MRHLYVFFLLAACAHESASQYAAERTAELRAEYPPGRTTRTDVASRQGHAPMVTLARPGTGWTARIVLDAETRTGALIARADEYVSPAGTSAGLLTLAHVWYFYDRDDHVVDVVWERMGD